MLVLGLVLGLGTGAPPPAGCKSIDVKPDAVDVALPEEIDDAAASAATSVGGTSLRAAVSRLALSGLPPRPLLMRIACSIGGQAARGGLGRPGDRVQV